MDLLVCPVDGTPVKVVQRQHEPEAGPLVRCPHCGNLYLLTRGGNLEQVAGPESS